MKVLFLTKYGRQGASSRYRTLQYIPYFRQCGFECTVSPLFDDDYLRNRYSSGNRRWFHLNKAVTRRLISLVASVKYDLIFIEYEVIPYGPALAERLLKLLKVPYVVDYDDAQFHRYDRHPNPFLRTLLRNKIKTVIAGAELVIVGNKYLADYVRQTNSKVELIPTVVDLRKYKVHSMPDDDCFIVGWIGTPITASYLKEILHPLQRFLQRCKGKLLLVGAGKIDLPGLCVEVQPWDENTEVDSMQRFDVGIMPLRDEPYERGKCGLKLIQYMACSRPVIASPVGVNRRLVVDGENGFLAENQEQWFECLRKLHDNPTMRVEMGRKGRLLVQSQYSLEMFQEFFLRHLTKAVLSKGGRNRP